MNFFTGVVENRDDPLQIGRCQVRIVGLHTDDKTKLPTEDLPWAHPVTPITSAAMNGIGWTPTGPVPGTWVILIFSDEDNQSPLMLGTLPGIPQSKAAAVAHEESDSTVIANDGGILKDSSGQPVVNADGVPITVGTADAQSQPPISTKPTTAGDQPNLTEQETPNVPATLNKNIPTTPPPNSTNNTSQASTSIQALISACDKVGLTSKYAKCAILGICGGESAWQPVPEGYYYSKPESLLAIFKGVFQGDLGLATQYSKWQGSREDFFRKIYSPDYSNGRNAGNVQKDDGAKFYGRGFNQITGRRLYEQLDKALKAAGVSAGIVDNPNLLLTDVNVSAAATAMFYKLNVKHDQNDPGYFLAALKRTGADAAGTGYAKKKKYYDYFLGQDTSVPSTNKPAADAQTVYTQDSVAGLPPAKQSALLEDRSEKDTMGFRDPKGKYPLRNLLDEPDTNRLARGIQKETAIEFKDTSRTKSIPAPNGQDSWDQPLAPFGGTYPYNKMYESESGHLFVLDDTPTDEMISLYHRTGTFIDIDGNGTQVNKIIGDGYTIYDRNGFISIQGKCNITVGNSCNLYVMGTADVQIDGAATVNVNNDLNLGIAGDANIAVGGDLNFQVEGEFQVKSNSGIGLQAAVDLTMKAAGNLYGQADGDISLKNAGDMYMDTAGMHNILAGGDTFTQAAGAANIKAGGNVNVDGSEFHGQEGSAGDATAGQDVIDIYTVTAPTAGEASQQGANADTQTAAGQQTDQGTAPMDGATDQNATTATPGKDLTPPSPTDFRPDQYDILTTPVRPSPPVTTSFAIDNDNNELVQDYISNPSKYYNADADAGGVKGNYAGTPKDDGNGQSLIGNGVQGDIATFLTRQLQAAQQGYWAETGMGGSVSNQNILRIWTDLGYNGKGVWATDQTAWCMGFVNWVLKQCGYRYVQTASAAEITTNSSRWQATQITNLADAQPGDIAFWRYRHVNFVYTSENGKLTFVGGNQANKAASNPSGGDVTQAWKPGYKVPGDNTLVSIWRPSKV